jgi:hypothetical protein
MELYVNVMMGKTIRLNHYSSFTVGVSVHVVKIYFFCFLVLWSVIREPNVLCECYACKTF